MLSMGFSLGCLPAVLSGKTPSETCVVHPVATLHKVFYLLSKDSEYTDRNGEKYSRLLDYQTKQHRINKLLISTPPPDLHGSDVARFWQVSGPVPAGVVLLHHRTHAALWEGQERP